MYIKLSSEPIAAAGEDAKSIIEFMETSYPCLGGKLTEERISEMVKGVRVAP